MGSKPSMACTLSWADTPRACEYTDRVGDFNRGSEVCVIHVTRIDQLVMSKYLQPTCVKSFVAFHSLPCLSLAGSVTSYRPDELRSSGVLTTGQRSWSDSCL